MTETKELQKYNIVIASRGSDNEPIYFIQKGGYAWGSIEKEADKTDNAFVMKGQTIKDSGAKYYVKKGYVYKEVTPTTDFKPIGSDAGFPKEYMTVSDDDGIIYAWQGFDGYRRANQYASELKGKGYEAFVARLHKYEDDPSVFRFHTDYKFDSRVAFADMDLDDYEF